MTRLILHAFFTPSNYRRFVQRLPQWLASTRMVVAAMLFCLMAACGGGQTLTHPDAGVKGESIPMSVDKGHASVKVFINGHSLRFLLDSGADQNVISGRAAAELGLPLSTQTVPGNGAAGSYGQVHWIDISEMTIGSARLPRQAAFIIPSFPEGAGFDGVLGTPFFQSFIVQLDYQQRTMLIHSRSTFTPPFAAAKLPLKIENGHPLVFAKAAGVSGWYQVDTGAAGAAVTMFTPTVEKYALRTAFSPSVRIATGIGAGGALTEGDLVRIPTLDFGPFQFQQVVIELSLASEGFFAQPGTNIMGNLGAELFRRFTVTLDYAGAAMYLQVNNAFTQPFDAPRSGLVAHLSQGQMKVIQVVPSSPAAQAGVQPGDIILSIDFAGNAYQAPKQISDVLRGAVGSRLVLHLRGVDGNERFVTMVLRDLL